MKIAYICHPIKGDVPGNMEKIRQIVRHINLTERRVVPFAPYMVDLQVLDDNIPAERAKGIYNDYEYFNRKMVDEVRVYGDILSEGMQAEIDLARRHGIPVTYFPYPPVIAERALCPPVFPPDRAGGGESAECARWKYAYEDMNRNMETTHIAKCEADKESEAVKKERDWFKEQFNLLRDKYSRVVPERDEAVKLLEAASDIVKKCNYPGASYSVPGILKALFDNNVNSFISLQSSGETKPASPWISVEDRLPEDGQSVAFIVDNSRQNNGLVLGGKYLSQSGYPEFSIPGHGFCASHWMPLPAPPESLTNKKSHE